MSYDCKSRRIYRQGDDPNYEIGWSTDTEGEEEFNLMENLEVEKMAWETD